MSCPKCHQGHYALPHSETVARVALIGNPNVGKSTIFNALTGSQQHVGNWPSKTVTVARGLVTLDEQAKIELIDLPGTYSLSGFTDEEIVTKEFLQQESVDLIVTIASVDTLARNLYLTLQLLETERGAKVVLIINKSELLRERGESLDLEVLKSELGIPCFLMSARATADIRKLKEFLTRQLVTRAKRSRDPSHFQSDQALSMLRNIHSEDVVKIVDNIRQVLERARKPFSSLPLWHAIRLLEDDVAAWQALEQQHGEARDDVKRYYQELRNKLGEKPLVQLVSARYEYIDQLVPKIITKETNEPHTIKWQDALDSLFLNPAFQVIATFLVLFVSFWLVFELGTLFQNFIGMQVGIFREHANTFLGNLNVPEFIMSFLLSELGVLGAIDTLLQFIPLIVLFYFIFAFLEHSGVLARFAYSLDRLLSKFGLQGRAFFPMTMSLGCNVVGIYNTKILENSKMQVFLSMSIPYIPCSARLPVLAALLTLLVPHATLASLFLLAFIIVGYILTTVQSWILARLSSLERRGLILELPTYTLPPFSYLLKLTWIQTKLFLQKAGFVMVAGIIIVWILANVPPGTTIERSVLGQVASLVSWFFVPLGFDWKAVTALIFGFVAKENALVVLQGLYGGIDLVPLGFTVPSMVAFLVFFAYYTPCLPTVAALRHRLDSWKLTVVIIIANVLVAFLLAFLVFLIGSLFT